MVRRLFGKYSPGNTLLHTLDLRIKLIGVCILVSTALVADSWLDLGAIAIMVLVTVCTARMPARELIKDFWALRLLYLVTVLLHSVLSSGQMLLQLPFGLTVTVQGIERGFFFASKIALLTAFVGPFMRTTHLSSFLRLFNPGGGRIKILRRIFTPLTLTFGIAIRFLPLILEEVERIRWSQVSRGLNFRGGIIRKAKTLTPLLTPLLSASFDRVDVITTAMQSRGFSLSRERTNYNRVRLGAKDYLTLLLVIVVAIITLI